MSAITMSAAAVRPVVARANVARRYVPHANVARGAADRFRRRASHRDRDRNARVCFRGDGSSARAGRSGPGARARADAAAIVAKQIASRPSPTPARVAGLARSKRAVRRSGAARSIPSIAVGYPLRAPRIRGHSRGPRSIKPRVRLTVRPHPLSPRSSTRAVAPAGKNLSARVCVPPRAVPRSSKRPLSPLAEGATQPLGVLAFSRRASRFKTND